MLRRLVLRWLFSPQDPARIVAEYEAAGAHVRSITFEGRKVYDPREGVRE